nr:hypothetical protein BaRGS_009078 [Batillaria attramentaria]
MISEALLCSLLAVRTRIEMARNSSTHAASDRAGHHYGGRLAFRRDSGLRPGHWESNALPFGYPGSPEKGSKKKKKMMVMMRGTTTTTTTTTTTATMMMMRKRRSKKKIKRKMMMKKKKRKKTMMKNIKEIKKKINK